MGNEKRKLKKHAQMEKTRTKNSGLYDDYLMKIDALKKSSSLVTSIEVKMQIIQDLKRLEKMIEFSGANRSVEQKIDNMAERIKRARER